jgi:hypothetical protein
MKFGNDNVVVMWKFPADDEINLKVCYLISSRHT